MFQHGKSARAEAAFTQQCGDGGGTAAVVAQHQQAHAAEQLRVERGDGAGNHRQRHHVLQWPAHSGSGQRARGGGWQCQHFIGRYPPRKAGPDAEKHRVAAGQHTDGLATQGQYRINGERTRPELAVATNARRQQIQMPLTAEDP
ncbi:hypothetical protein D3C85_1104000 [compost metagenome]